MPNSVDLEKAVNWFFKDGIKALAKNPRGQFNACAGSSANRIIRLAELMMDDPAEILTTLYKKNYKPHIREVNEK